CAVALHARDYAGELRAKRGVNWGTTKTCIAAPRLIPRFARNENCRRVPLAGSRARFLGLFGPRTGDARTRITVLDAIHRRAKKITLQILDLHRSVTRLKQPAQRAAIEDNRAQLERLSANGVADELPLGRAGAQGRRIENADDLGREFCFI